MNEYRGENESYVRREELSYLMAYDEWVMGMSDAERAALSDAGVDVPDLDQVSRSATGLSRDASELSAAAVDVDFAGRADTAEARMQEAFGLSAEQARGVCDFFRMTVEREASKQRAQAISFIAAEFVQAANLKLYCAALAFAADLHLTTNMGSMREWSRQNGLSVAAVSKVSKHLRRELRISEGAGMHLRDERISKICAKAQRDAHWRKLNFKRINHEHEHNNNDGNGSGKRKSKRRGMGISLGCGKAGGGRKGTSPSGAGKVDGDRA